MAVAPFSGWLQSDSQPAARKHKRSQSAGARFLQSVPSLLPCTGHCNGQSLDRFQKLRTPPTEDVLVELLQDHGVDIFSLGQGKAKPVISLLRELRESSSTLQLDRKIGRLCRHAEPVFVQLTYNGKVLVELAQVLPNGKRRQVGAVLAEKREPTDTTPLDTALRGIREELNVDVDHGTEGLVHNAATDVQYIEEYNSKSHMLV